MHIPIRLARGAALLAFVVTSSVGASTVSAVSVAAASPAAAHARATTPLPLLAITPNTNLVDDESVTVTAPHGVSGYAVCPPGYVDVGFDCTYLADHTSGHATDVLQLPARTVESRPDGTFSLIDCRTVACTLVAFKDDLSASGPDSGEVAIASVTLAFDPVGALRAAPTIAVTPNSGLVDGTPLTVTVHPAIGGLGGGGASALQCAAPIQPATVIDDILHSCTLDAPIDLAGPVGGDATGTAAASAYVETATGPVDCRAVAATCSLVTIDPVVQTASAPLSFTPDGAVHPALFTRPNFDLAATTETYDLVGFTAADTFTLKWCNSSGGCLHEVAGSGTTDANGVGSAAVSQFPDISAADGETCALGCTLTATDTHGLTAKGGPVIGIVALPPTGPGSMRSKRLPVVVSPHKGLHNGQSVSVTASGFAPGATVAALQCSDDALTKGPGQCDLTSLVGSLVTADSHGHVSTTIEARSHITTAAGQALDCTKGNVDPDAYDAGVAKDPSRAPITASGYFTCAVVVVDLLDFTQSGGDPIAFAGARFKPLPWEVTPTAYHPPTAPAPAAAPVAAQPTFTG